MTKVTYLISVNDYLQHLASFRFAMQLYIRDLIASVTQPVKSLKGFKRVHLNPGECKRISFSLSANQLGFYNQEMAFVVEPGEIELMVGTSSEDLPLTTTITIVGETVEVEQDKVFSSGVVVDELSDIGGKT